MPDFFMQKCVANCSGILSDFWGDFYLVDGLWVLGHVGGGGVNVWSVSASGCVVGNAVGR